MLYLVLALILLSPVVFLAVLARLSRKPGRLGLVDGRLAPCPPCPNCVSTQATDPAHAVDPIPFADPAEEALRRLKAVLADCPRLSIVTEDGPYLRAAAVSRVFRFVDDVEFLIDAEAKRIHFRSASRVGRSDLGANRARMEQIRQAFTSRGKSPA